MNISKLVNICDIRLPLYSIKINRKDGINKAFCEKHFCNMCPLNSDSSNFERLHFKLKEGLIRIRKLEP